MTTKQHANSQPIELTFHVEPDAWLPVAELLTMFHPANSQTRNRAELEAIKRHLVDEGFTAEMIVVNPWNRKIVSGHGRTQAAHELGFAGSLPVVYREYPSEAEHRRAMLRWNLARGHQDEAKEAAEFAALLAEFDREDLAADFGLEDGEFEALLAGFADEPDSLEDPGPQTDRAEELREKWQVESGQLWQLGAHRLICGDCTDRAVVERVMGGERAIGAFTSPPYAEQRAHVYESYSADEYVEWWGQVQEQTKNALGPDANFFVNIKAHSKEYKRSLYVMDMACAMVRRWGWDYIDEFSWLRLGIPGDPKKMGKFKNQFEPIHHFATGNYPFFPSNVMHESDNAILDFHYQPGFGRNFQGQGRDVFGERKQGKGMAYPGNVIKTGQTEALGHSASFPVDLPAFFIAAYSEVGGIWYEPFSGSASTLIACQNLGRKCRATEIAPGYVAVSLERFFQATGERPVLVSP